MKTIKRILLAIITLPLLAIGIFTNMIWLPFIILIAPLAILFMWLKEDYWVFEPDWWKILFIPFGIFYLDTVWDIDIL